MASFLLHGCNAKYTHLHYKDLVRVPQDVDPFEAVALIRTYTAAFQVLMHGIDGHERYSQKPLINKRILLVGRCGTFERAVIDLANLLGAKRVYFSAHSSTHAHYMYIRLLGARPISDNPGEFGFISVEIIVICKMISLIQFHNK